MTLQRGAAGLTAIIVLALLVVLAYTAFTANAVYQDLENGRGHLVAAQNAIAAGEKSGDAGVLQGAGKDLHDAEQDFETAQQKTAQDPALRLLNRLPGSGPQLQATSHLAAIGVDLSRAGEAADVIALEVSALKRQYGGRALTADDLQALLQQAQAVAANYKGSIDQIGSELKAAHAERARVTTTGLVSPLHQAYDDVDVALTTADTAFLRYQDVRQVLADLLGVRLSG